jgi:mannose-6-phosphate isomerase-like protein (cupin superfamily)
MNTTLAQARFVRRNQARAGHPLQVFDDVIYIKLAGSDTGGMFSVMEDVTAPQAGPPLHLHHREDVSFYVVDGEYLFEIDGKRVEAKAGDFVFAPRNTRHCFMNTGESDGRLLTMVQPAGLDDFFEDLAQIEKAVLPEKAAAVFAKHGMEFLGHPWQPVAKLAPRPWHRRRVRAGAGNLPFRCGCLLPTACAGGFLQAESL